MKANDVFPGKYLRADDLGGKEPIVTIKSVHNETLGDELKPILMFEGKEKGLVLNKTNWSAIADITGQDDSDDWAGARVKLVTRKVDFQGKRVPAIRIEEPTAKPQQKPLSTKPVPAVSEDNDDGSVDGYEDVGF